MSDRNLKKLKSTIVVLVTCMSSLKVTIIALSCDSALRFDEVIVRVLVMVQGRVR